jgi:hypothetical protein
MLLPPPPLTLQILKLTGCRGGLTACYRSHCGKDCDATEFVQLLEQQLAQQEQQQQSCQEEEEDEAGCDPPPPLQKHKPTRKEDEKKKKNRISLGGLSPTEYVNGCNSHLYAAGIMKEKPEPASFAIYGDVNSMYGGSGKKNFFRHFFPSFSSSYLSLSLSLFFEIPNYVRGKAEFVLLVCRTRARKGRTRDLDDDDLRRRRAPPRTWVGFFYFFASSFRRRRRNKKNHPAPPS